MKHVTSKILAWLLAIATVVGLLPLSAFPALAAPTPQEAIDEALAEVMIYNSGENYK